MPIKTTELTYSQYMRFINLLTTIDQPTPTMVELVEVIDTPLKKFNAYYANGETESVYPTNAIMNIILNGIHLKRNEG